METPDRETLVELQQVLGEPELRIVLRGVLVQRHQGVEHACVGLMRQRHVALQHRRRDGEAAARQVPQEMVVQRRLPQRLGELQP